MVSTDWNAELDLLQQYIDWRVDNLVAIQLAPTLTMHIGTIGTLEPWYAKYLMDMYRKQGILILNSMEPEPVKLIPYTFERWKEERSL